MTRRDAVWGVAICLAVICIVVLAGCPAKPKLEPPAGNPTANISSGNAAGNGGTATSGKAAATSGEPIKIGAIFSVSGPNAPLGEPEKAAAQMIEKQVNANGGVLGRQISVIVKDDETQEVKAVTAAKDLIETERVCAIIGPSGTPTTMAIKDICEKAGVPLISCAAGRPITAPLAKWVFAVPQTDALAVAKVLDHLKAQKITSVATIYVANPYGESGQKQLEAQLKPAGIKIMASESFGPKDTDMTAPLTKIKASNPAAVICWGTNPGPALVAKGMQKLGMKMPLIQSHGVANGKFLELAGDAAEGVTLPAGRLIVWQAVPDSNPQKAVLKDFATAFKEETKKDADTFAGHAYDSLHILLKAIETAGGDDRAKVRDAIEATKGFVGTAGVFNYSATDHNGLTKDAFVWVKVAKGGWALAE